MEESPLYDYLQYQSKMAKHVLTHTHLMEVTTHGGQQPANR